jgi:hypothetical protein
VVAEGGAGRPAPDDNAASVGLDAELCD